MLAAVGVVVGTTLGIAGASWACTSSASLSTSPNYGPVGSNVTVTGSSFTDGRVEIRWNGVSGPLIGEATGPNFSISVKIPSAARDNYVILAVARAVANDGSETVWQKAAPFEVTAVGAAPSKATRPSGTTTSGSSGSTSGNTSGSTSGRTTAGDDGGSPTASGTAEQGAAPETSDSPVQGGAAVSTDGRRSAGSSAVTGTRGTADGRRASASRTAAASAGPGESAPAPGTASDPVASPSMSGASDSSGPAATLSPRSATDDLWGGFASTTESSTRGPALLGPSTPASGSGSSSMVLGVGLLSAGVVALASGATIAGLRRRRAGVAPSAS